jgi:hypothetical protein
MHEQIAEHGVTPADPTDPDGPMMDSAATQRSIDNVNKMEHLYEPDGGGSVTEVHYHSNVPGRGFGN